MPIARIIIRRTFRGLAWTLLVAAVVFVILWLARTTLIAWALAMVLDHQGHGPAEVQVERADLSQLHLSSVVLIYGDVEGVTVDYTLSELLAGRVSDIAITRGRLDLRKGTPLGEDSGASQSVPLLPFDDLSLRDLEIVLPSAEGPVTFILNGQISGGHEPRTSMSVNVSGRRGKAETRVQGGFIGPERYQLQADVTALQFIVGPDIFTSKEAAISLEGQLGQLPKVSGTGTLLGGPQESQFRQPIQLLVEADLETGAVDLHARGAAGDLSLTSHFLGDRYALRLTGTMLLAPMAQLLGQKAGVSGLLSIDLAGETPPAPALLALADVPLPDWRDTARLNGTVELQAVAIEELGRIAAGKFMLSAAPEAIAIGILEPLRGNVPVVPEAPFTVAQTQGPAVRWARTENLLRVRLAAAAVTPDESATALMDVRISEPNLEPSWQLVGAFEGEVDLSGTLDGKRLGAGALRFTGDLSPGRMAFSELRIHLEDLYGPFYSAAAAELDMPASAGAIAWAQAPPAKLSLRLNIPQMELDGVSLELGAQAITLAGVLPRVDLRLEGLRVAVPDQQLLIDGASVTVTPDQEAIAFDISAPVIRRGGLTPSFAPLSAQAHGRWAQDRLNWTATAADRTGALNLALKGRYDLRSGAGVLDIDVTSLDFATEPGLLQRLVPVSPPDLSLSEGGITLSGPVYFGAEGLRSELLLELEALSGQWGDRRMDDLTGTLLLTSPWPLASAPDQKLALRLTVPPLAESPVSLRYSISEGRLEIADLSATMLGGTIGVQGGILDGLNLTGTLPLRLTRVDLGAALALADLEELSGTGLVNGLIPISFADGGVVISAGRMQAIGPGTLRISSPALAEQVMEQGDTIDMVLQALSDFQYQDLSLTLDKSLAGPGQVGLSLRGANPALLEGHPFIFNINLETDFDKMARVLQQALEATDEALGWGVQQVR